MTIPRPFAAVIFGSEIGLGGVGLILWVVGGPCTATDFFFDHPLHALAGTAPPGYGISSFGVGLDCMAGNPSPLKTWLMLWGPIVALTGIAGAISSRGAGSKRAGGIAGIVIGLATPYTPARAPLSSNVRPPPYGTASLR